MVEVANFVGSDVPLHTPFGNGFAILFPNGAFRDTPLNWVLCRLMSPTIYREKGYRFFFFYNEVSRMHVHVICGDGEAKYWLEPTVELAKNIHLKKKQLSEIQRIVEAHEDEFIEAWKEAFRD